MQLRTFRKLWTAGLLMGLVACTQQPKELRIATGKPGTVYNSVGSSMARMLAEELKLPVTLETSDRTGTIANCKLLLSGEVDFALIQDDTPLDSCAVPGAQRKETGLRTVIPVFPEIFFVFHHPSVQGATLRELVKGRRVGLDQRNSSDARFALRLFDEFGIDSADFTAVYLPHNRLQVSDSLPIVCMLTAYTDPKVREQLLGRRAAIFSLDDPALAGKGSAADGFCMKYVHAHTFTLPRFTYGDYPRQPVLTVAVDAILATRADVDPHLVHEVTRLLIEEEPRLANENILFQFMNEKFDYHTLDFPLHEGALKFFRRDEPSFLERFAEVIALGISAMLLLYGAAGALLRWLRLRKKNRVDTYYDRALQIELASSKFTAAAEYDNAIAQLHALRYAAFEELAAERLLANESFLIFTQLVQSLLTMFEARAEALRTQA